ncbi:peptidoglycan DD-metalloendopeptidase family protein [Streptomyces griseofuscus]|uniref:peptidoglycan DD-metalloendopeptidase family protein n=1 Tax=Streptomyces griseofuscus TaxID=146922 RepID=UPI0036AF455D
MADATMVGSTRVSLIPDMSQFGDRLRIELPSAIKQPAKDAGDVAGDTIRTQITKKLLKPISVKVMASLDDKAASLSLKNLTKTQTVKLTAQLDDKAATSALARLTKDRKIKITAQLDDTAATTGLKNLTKDQKVKVTAQLDDKAAVAALAKLTKDRKVKIQAVIDDSAAKTKLRFLSGKQTVEILPTMSSAAYNAAKKKIDRLTANRVVNIRASVDTRVGANEIQNLIRRRTLRIGVDVDTRVAADSLAALTRRRQMTVQARADTASADAAIRLASRDRTTNVRVRALGLGTLATQLSGINGSSSGGASGVSALSSGLVRLATMAATALPTITSLGQVLAQMAPLAATAAPAVAAVGTAFAAIKLGTSGIGDAIKAAFQPAASQATKAASATKQVETAQRSLQKAQQSLADAQVQAAERVKQAQQQVANSERDLTVAQRDARQAQIDLTAARQQATRDLQDMNNSLKDSQLSERQATLQVQQAEEDLARVRSDPTATQEQIQQAILARDQAVQSLSEQQLATQRLQKDTAAANKAGAEGSKTVVDAKQKLADANQNVADKQKALADSQAAVVKAQVEGQRQIADAQQNVADALENVAYAQQKATTQASTLDTAMAKLSPNAKAFVNQLRAMAPAWTSMKLGVQDSLFAGIAGRLHQVGSQVLPTVRSGLVGAAGELNLMGKNALTAVSNLQKTGTLKSIFDGVKTSLGNLSKVPGQLVTGFGQLTVAAQPAFDRMTKGAAGTIDRVMNQLSQKFKDGSLTKTINTALNVAVQFGKVLGNIGSILGGVFKAASAAGGDFFGTIGAAIAEIARIIKMPEVQAALTSIFKALNAVAKLLAGALGAALQAILPLLATIAPFITQLAHTLGPIVSQLFSALGKALMPVIKALMPVISQVIAAVAKMIPQLLPLLQPLGNLIAAIIKAVAPFLPMLAQILGTVVTAVVQLLTPIIKALLPVVMMIGKFLGQLAPLFPPILQALLPLIPPLGQLIAALLQLAMSVIQPLLPLIVMLAKLLTTVLAGAVKFLVPIITTVIGWITKFVDMVTNAVKWVVKKFQELFDILLGHSIIPDIVNGMTSWFKNGWKWLKGIVKDIKDGVVNAFNDLKNGAASLWNKFWGGVKSTASDAWKLVKSGFDKFADGLKQAFQDVRDGIGTVWNGLKKLAAAPIKFFIETVYNNGLVRVWNATAGKIPGIPDMKTMSVPKGFARGGVLPGWSSWRDGDDQLVPMRRGEGVYVSEVMRDPYERQRLYALNAAAMRGQHPAIARAQYGFAEGGILGGIKSIGSGIADGVGSVLKKGSNAVRGGLADIAAAAFKPIRKGINEALGTNASTWPGAIAHAPLNFMDKAIDYIRGKDAPDASGQWIKPVNVPFGTRFGVKGSMWSSGRHTGLDFPAKVGTKVVAVDNGTVSQITNGGPYGKHVMVNHGGGLQSLYAHMSAIAAKMGGIKQGARIGSVGATGNVTGPHLHLEARVNGKAVDPMPYLTGPTGDGGSGVQRWKGVVQQALGEVHQSLSLVNTTLRRMNQESGGNPTAVNRWDSNWKAGHPSVGLLQLIDRTFRTYAGKYKNSGPFMYGVSVDPLANVYASMRYALARYGSLSAAYNRPGGYARGGLVGGVRIGRGLPRGYAKGGVIKVGGKKIDTGPIAASVGDDFLKQLAGTAAQIDAAMSKVATAVKNAFKGVKTTLDDKLLASIRAQTTKLDTLAKARDAIAAKITAANQLAADSTNQANSFAQLTSLPNSGNTFDAGGILSGLQVRLGQIKDFAKNIKILGDRGLSKTLLQQIISAGPDQGAAYAKALVDATPAQLKQINSAQDQISKASTQYGKTAADAMYDAGAQSGKGYLAGLKAQEASINKAMSDLAKKIQQSIKKALKIKSPSRVFAELGKFTVAGFAQGMRAATPEAAQAASQMAALVRTSAAATSSRIESNTSTTTVGDRHLHYNATVREQASRQSILAALALDDTLHRPVVVGG